MARSVAGSPACLTRSSRRCANGAGGTQLGALNDGMLRDIGISPAEATYLSSKPFWKE